jgi:hydrogenase maturation protein HypF
MSTAAASVPVIQARRLVLSGRVQGVGFRPFVYRTAHAHGIAGWVRNDGGRVVILAQGPPAALQAFIAELLHRPPPLAQPHLHADEPLPPENLAGFAIRASNDNDALHAHVTPDQFACDDCLREMDDPHDRRYRYPFINCTQCGPRYTLIRRLPYDRPNTTMAGFELCPDCAAEYRNPLDRRFHAQPLACPRCGPRLSWHAGEKHIAGNDSALNACLAALHAGAIVAVRGIGGYHLMCDAANEGAVRRLRTRKQRPHKPLAVMVPMTGADGLDWVRRLARPDAAQIEQLGHPRRPIVLVPARRPGKLAAGIAPGLSEVGLMLPYSPLHHLLLSDFGGPLVATSGNISGEPVITAPEEAEQRLAPVADGFLHHDRPIRRPADDPVYRSGAFAEPLPLRLGRGNAPLELTLPEPAPVPMLALGAFIKNTIALAWDDRVVVSPHIGDLRSPRSRRVLAQVATDLQDLYGVRAEAIVHDAHPGFPVAWRGEHARLPRLPVYHHHAHAAALAGEIGDGGRMLVFTWDGVGYGEDGTLWGGEALLGQPGEWRRKASLRPFRLPGGDAAVAQPWRTALALCWEAGHPWSPVDDSSHVLLRKAWEHRLNSPLTSAAGRLFDAAAVLTGLLHEASFEGHGPMWLEAAAAPGGEPVALPVCTDQDGIWRTDWSPLLPLLTDTALTAEERAGRFHASLAQAIVDQAVRIRDSEGINRVGLTGGVFQNRRLATEAATRLTACGFSVALPRHLPANDAGISYGQIIESVARPLQAAGM